MSDQTLPALRLMAAPLERSAHGRQQLGGFSEVGAVWPAKSEAGRKWLPVNFNIVPSGLGHGHVKLFLAPVGDAPITSNAPEGKPMFRIMAAPVVDRGQLGSFHSTGAVWPPKTDGGKWAPFNLDLVPMGIDRGSVKLFLMPYEEPAQAEKPAGKAKAAAG